MRASPENDVLEMLPSIDEKPSTEFARKLLSWSRLNSRDFPWRKEIDPYSILVAEKLLQQTASGHVLKAYRHFVDRFPNVKSLAQADTYEIEETIRPLGFHRQRSRQLKALANKIVEEHNGIIPSNRTDLLALPGIGEYVASAVLCFAFNEDCAIVDTNVRRVVGRYFGWHGMGDDDMTRRLDLIIPKGHSRDFNLGLIDFSALVCARSPKCRSCFLARHCLYIKSQRPALDTNAPRSPGHDKTKQDSYKHTNDKAQDETLSR